MNPANAPGWGAVAISTTLIVLAAAIAARERLGVTRELLVAALRAAAQLAAVGLVLLVLFTRAGLPGSLAWVAVMVLIAGRVASHRGRGIPHATRTATIAVGAGTAASLGLLLAAGIIAPVPQQMVPIGGMITSGAMQAAGLTLRQLAGAVTQARAAIEARLCLGLPADEAFAAHRRGAARTALLPALDATKVVGLISLPGAMTGLILAGVDPMTAIRYQIIVMYMLLTAAAIAAALATRLAQATLFDHAHRLRAGVGAHHENG
jgi:putative ABC transport system permease protein